MATDVRLITSDSISGSDGYTCTSNKCIYNHVGQGDTPPPPYAPSPTGATDGPKQRRFSTQTVHPNTRVRSPSGGSNMVGARTSPLTNIMFLDEFTKEELGKGFFAEVYKVCHRFTGQVMAVKINTHQSNWDNVQHEIQLMSRLNHPNIVRFMGLCIHDGNLHPLLEFINGGTLTDLLCDDQVYLSWVVRISLAGDIAGAMAYLHKKNIMHRDITSSNVLIKRNNLDIRAILCDLGLSCRIPRDTSEVKSPVGTPFWMAPEVLNHKFYNEKADVFSFGIVMCEIIARISADPEELPRFGNFGLDEGSFRTICGNCPEMLLDLAFLCCKMNPCMRPAFLDVELQLQHIKMRRKGRSKSEKGAQDGTRARRHTVYLNVPEIPNVSQLPATRKQPLVRSNSDRGVREKRHARHHSRTNPFDTPDLKGGKMKFISSGREHLKQLSPDMSIDIGEILSVVFGNRDVIDAIENPVQRRMSVSLPSSPELHRRELSLDEEDLFDDIISWPSSPEANGNDPINTRTSLPSEQILPPNCVKVSAKLAELNLEGDRTTVGVGEDGPVCRDGQIRINIVNDEGIDRRL